MGCTGHRWGVALTFVGFLVFADVSAAQPSIGSVSGTFAHGATAVISGNSFGTKTTAAPRVWENFDDGTLTSMLFAHGTMPYTNSDNLRHQFAVHNARANFKVSAPGGDGNYFSFESGTASKWFVQYWVKLASNWHWGTTVDYGQPDDGLANIKFLRWFPTGARNYTNVRAEHRGGSIVHADTDSNAYAFSGWNLDDLSLDTWHLIQAQYGENSGAGVADGHLTIWVDGSQKFRKTNFITNAAGDGTAVNKRPYVIGFFDSWPPSDAAVANMYAYYTDIYVDDTWARVELGNASTYSACTRREIQIPTAWNGSSISVKVNQGTFADGQTAYLYVVDASGAVNAVGVPVVIAGSGPQAPTNLRIVP